MATITQLLNARYGKHKSIGGSNEAHSTIEGLLSRHSIRSYKEKTISEEHLELLLACAQSAPTKSNLQQYSIIVVQGQGIREQLAPWCPRTNGLEEKPLLLVFCADIRRNQRIGQIHQRPHVNNNMDTFLNGVVDAALALGFFVIAAEASGLGTAPLSSLRDNIHAVTRILGIPEGVFPIAGVMAGWPENPGYINQRLPQSVVVHYDQYNDSNLEKDIQEYNQTRNAIFPIPDESQTRTDLWGVAEFYGWSEHISRQLGKPERPEFKEFLKNHGFDLN